MSGASSVTAPLSSETTASCGLQGSNPGSQHATASVTAGSFSVSAAANVAWALSQGTGSSSGKASVTEQYQVESAGPVRPGFLVLTPFVSTTPDLDLGSTFAQVAVNGAGSFTAIESHLGSVSTCSPCEYAVTLGTIYDFTLSASVDSEASVLDQIPDDSGSASATLGFQFYEANGTTPVSAEVIPEPSTAPLVGCALLAGLATGFRQRQKTARRCRSSRKKKAAPMT